MLHNKMPGLTLRPDDNLLVKGLKIYGKLMLFSLFFWVIIALMARSLYKKTSNI